MHAIEVTRTGGPEVLRYVERPIPEPGPGQVLIKAAAIGVNFINTYFRTGMYPHPFGSVSATGWPPPTPSAPTPSTSWRQPIW